MNLTKEQVARYGRQLILPEVGVRGQQRLLKSSVLIVGAGGLGSPAALYLTAAGVGHLGVVDYDAVSLSNLHRQILHQTCDLGRAKSESARIHMQALNPDICIEAIQTRLDAGNVIDLVNDYDLVLDGSDNFTTRYLVNDACVISQIPLIYAGVVRFMGQILVIRPRESACFRCVFPEPPPAGGIPSCQEAGILGAVAGILGSVMAHEALKQLLGMQDGLVNRLVTFDGLKTRFREVPVQRDPHCAVCGVRPTIQEVSAIEDESCVDQGAFPTQSSNKIIIDRSYETGQ